MIIYHGLNQVSREHLRAPEKAHYNFEYTITMVDITNSRFGRIRVCCTFFSSFPLARQHHQWLKVLLGRSDLKIKSLVVVLLLDINQYVPLHAHSYYVTTLDGKCIWTLERQ